MVAGHSDPSSTRLPQISPVYTEHRQVQNTQLQARVPRLSAFGQLVPTKLQKSLKGCLSARLLESGNIVEVAPPQQRLSKGDRGLGFGIVTDSMLLTRESPLRHPESRQYK